MKIITDDIKKYDEAWWEKFYAVFDHSYTPNERSCFAIAANIIKGSRVIDVGCGEGFFSGYCNNYFGIDWSEEAIRKAKIQCGQQFACMDIDDVDGSFEFALLSMVFEHLEDPKDYIRRIRRVANKVIVIIPKGDESYNTMAADRNLLRPVVGDTEYHYANYEKEDIDIMFPDVEYVVAPSNMLMFIV